MEGTEGSKVLVPAHRVATGRRQRSEADHQCLCSASLDLRHIAGGFEPAIRAPQERSWMLKRRPRTVTLGELTGRRCLPSAVLVWGSMSDMEIYRQLCFRADNRNTALYVMPWIANGKTGSIAEAPPSTYRS